jgi:hypothetical protein
MWKKRFSELTVEDTEQIISHMPEERQNVAREILRMDGLMRKEFGWDFEIELLDSPLPEDVDLLGEGPAITNRQLVGD